jgi:hypothetical protein
MGNKIQIRFDPEDHRYWVDDIEYPSLSKICDQMGLNSGLRFVNPGVLKASRDLGSAVHEACQYWDEGNLDIFSMDPKVRSNVLAWQQFKDDFKVQEVIAIEERLASLQYRYACTLDRVVRIQDQMVLLDIKTSTSIPRVYGLKSAGYRVAWEEMTGMGIDREMIVKLQPEKSYPYRIKEYDDVEKQANMRGFIGMMDFHNWKR